MHHMCVQFINAVIALKNDFRGQRDSTMVRALALHVTDLGSFPGTELIPQALPGEIPKCRARSKVLSTSMYGPQTKIITTLFVIINKNNNFCY